MEEVTEQPRDLTRHLSCTSNLPLPSRPFLSDLEPSVFCLPEPLASSFLSHVPSSCEHSLPSLNHLPFPEMDVSLSSAGPGTSLVLNKWVTDRLTDQLTGCSKKQQRSVLGNRTSGWGGTDGVGHDQEVYCMPSAVLDT